MQTTPLARFLELLDDAIRHELPAWARSDGTPAAPPERPYDGPPLTWRGIADAQAAAVAELDARGLTPTVAPLIGCAFDAARAAAVERDAGGDARPAEREALALLAELRAYVAAPTVPTQKGRPRSHDPAADAALLGRERAAGLPLSADARRARDRLRKME